MRLQIPSGTLKKKRSKATMQIRKATGLPMAECHRVAKVVVNEGFFGLPEEYPSCVQISRNPCPCCGGTPEGLTISGPKGRINYGTVFVCEK